MQKSKVATIVIIILMLLFGLLGNLKLVKEINIIYLYIINPVVWLMLAIFLYLILGKNIENKKLQKPIIQYTVIASLAFILIYMLSGLVVSFGKNPYSATLKGLIHNIWITGTVLIAKEYVRYKLINNVYDKDKSKIAILISVVYIIIDFEFTRFIGRNFTMFGLVEYIIQTVLPNIAKNMVFSYMAIYSNYVSAMLYQILTNLYFWVSPILPNSPWIMTAIIDITIPVILFLYIQFVKNKLNIFRSRENIINSNPKNIIPLAILVILAIWFAIGIFPIKPVSIATGSMEKELCVGDIAIIKECKPNDVNVGDIIEYKIKGYSIIHRIIEKKQRNGKYYFITKGDNNGAPDVNEVKEEQLVGKVIFKIKYLGYPAIWLHILQISEDNIGVETGK